MTKEEFETAKSWVVKLLEYMKQQVSDEVFRLEGTNPGLDVFSLGIDVTNDKIEAVLGIDNGCLLSDEIEYLTIKPPESK